MDIYAELFVSLYKKAYHLDQQGLRKEMRKIEREMESLAKRVGLNIDVMVSLADYFDSMGDTETANVFDDMIHKYANKK